MERADGTGLLLLNLGTPSGTETSDLRRYLRQFLFDPRVVDIPTLPRWLVLNLFILPRRPAKSAALYKKIWTDRGSPLLFHTVDLTRKVQERLGPQVVVDFAMRYGEPSIEAALERMTTRGLERIVLFPLYPQYASATTGSTLDAIYGWAAKRWNVPNLQVVPPFYDHPAFIDAFAKVARPHLEGFDAERVYFSFHGLPERQIFKGDPTGTHCLKREDCCESIGRVNCNCYRAHCVATARALGERLGIPEANRRICFQSRLGKQPWIGPATDALLKQEAAAGCKRAAILSPAFVADCLETLEELGMQAAETWRENGGETLRLIPCPNADDTWAEAVVTIAQDAVGPLDRGAQAERQRDGHVTGNHSARSGS